MESTLDQVVLNFNKDSLILLNICIAFIMFGVALELKIKDFALLFKTPKPILVGLFSQLVLLPALTFVIVWIIEPSPSIAMGMFLVAACPGGNVSNFYSSMSRGNVALSVSLTAIVSTAAILVTPFNFTFWASNYGPTATLLEQFNLNVWNVVVTVIVILAIPLFLGMMFNNHYPNVTKKITKPIKKASIVIFAGFVIAALSANFSHFLNHIIEVVFIVFFHNLIALGSGFGASSFFGLSDSDRRSITIETGIQNSGLALVIIFDFFQGLGGMAFIAAWWGVWHLISGAFISFHWQGRNIEIVQQN